MERRIQGLERRIAALQALSRRFSWYRLAVLLLGGVATWSVSTYLEGNGGWWAFCASAVFFFIVVAFHQRLERWIEKFELWRGMRSEQLARLALDWEHIPLPALGGEWEQAALDIDLDLTGPRSLHQLLDVSVSRQGSLRLAGWLTGARPELERLRERQMLVRELLPMARFRERMLLTYRLASRERLNGEELLAWLVQDYPAGRLRWALPLAALWTALNMALFLADSFGALPAYWLISLPAYLAFYFWNAGVINGFLDAVVRLDNQLGRFKALILYLERYPLAGREALAALCAPFQDRRRPPSALLRKVKWVTAGVGLRMNPILGFLLNVILPWDFAFASLAGRCRQQAAGCLPLWLETCTELEALISLASLADLHPDYTFPEIDPQARPIFQANGLGHLLIPPEQKVRNDFSVDGLGKIAVITGSNMAGKSTFIKTVGINLCLAYAGGPVDAAYLRCAPFRLHTCIRISDSIADGFSYFYSEVRCLKRLLEALRASDDELPLLYLIDEIFRGTNNRERLIGSRAYVSALIGARGVGFLATHDLELASLADESQQVHNYHFCDRVQDGRLAFDYLIRRGPSPTTNALKIMQIEGLPVESLEG
ncbi:MAG: hypothetical protein JXA78_17105 [Anaerolineales bacterium]|nr:hypothetical protein [Anaerolineales bacterium]